MPPPASLLTPFLSVLLPILPLFGLMAVGVFARKRGLLKPGDSGALARFAVQVGLPALVLISLVTKPFPVSDIALPSLYWLVEAVALACIFAIKTVLKFDRATTGAAILTTFGNTGFIGYPITTALLPGQMPETILIDQLGMSLLLYGSIGLIGARYGERENIEAINLRTELRALARNPVFIALGIGLALHYALLAHPALLSNAPSAVILSCIALLGAATIPVIMTAVGMRLSAGDARRFLPLIGLFGAVKMLVMPLAAWAIGRILYHLTGPTLADCVLICAMPPAAAATAFSAELKIRPELCAANFFVLTIASAVTIPLVLGLLR